MKQTDLNVSLRDEGEETTIRNGVDGVDHHAESSDVALLGLGPEMKKTAGACNGLLL